MQSKILAIFTLILMLSLASCKGDKKKPDGKQDSTKTQFNEEDFFARIDQKKVVQLNEVIQGFASPVEIAATVKSQHIEFSKDYLLNTTVVTNYETSIKKALGLGLMSADLGYLTIYQKNGQMIDYLVTINNLAADLRVSQFYDFQVLKKMVTNSENMDSLLFLTVNSFHQIDSYFAESNRSYLTVMMATGVWLESLYLLTQVAANNLTKISAFHDNIGDQKDLLFKLIEILKVYKGHPQFDYIISQFDKLAKVYKQVNITIVQTQGKVEFVDGNYVIYPSEESKIDMSDQTLNDIIKTTAEIRTAIVNIK